MDKWIVNLSLLLKRFLGFLDGHEEQRQNQYLVDVAQENG